MRNRRASTPWAAVGLTLLTMLSAGPACRGADEAVPDPDWLRERLEKVRQHYHLPTLAAAVVVDGRVAVASAVGVRKWEDLTKVSRDDPFHLGSCAKPMTATLVGRLVDRGLIRWDSTLAQLFPELAAGMNPAYRGVTVAQLLSHTSGMPYQPTTPESVTDAQGRTVQEKRYEYVKAAVADPPEVAPGTKVVYGGGGIIVASALERIAKNSYEDLMCEHVFGPLGMTRAGFGSMATPGKLDVPRDHQLRNGKPVALDPDPAQAVQARAPVGRNIRCSILDFARFAALHAGGAVGGPDYLSRDAMRELHTRVGPVDFGPGWAIGKAYWAEGDVLSHSGSMGYNHALAYVVPIQRFAAVVLTNVEGDGVDDACQEVVLFLAARARRHQLVAAAAKAAAKLPPVPDVPLDGLKPRRATTGFGKVLPGKAANGKALILDGEHYARGIGTHAPSELIYPLRPEYRRFVARVGIDDQQCGHGSIRVEVHVDGRLVASSPLLRGGDPPWPVDVPLPRPSSGQPPGILRLVVNDGGDGHDWDLADWAQAGFLTRE
jgi:CubicO group peptidase (beta-lactamase class C family)